MIFNSSETRVWWEWVWQLSVSECSESPGVTVTWISARSSPGMEPPGRSRKSLQKSGSAFILLCKQLCRSFCLHSVPKNNSANDNTSSKLGFFVKCRLHEIVLSFWGFFPYLVIRTFFLLFVCHVFLDFEVIINQAIHTWVWCENEHYSGFILPPLAGRSSWFIVSFTTLIKLGDNFDFSAGKWDGNGSIQSKSIKSKYFPFHLMQNTCSHSKPYKAGKSVQC